MSAQDNLSPGQGAMRFYHGTVHSFKPGQMLTNEGADPYRRGDWPGDEHHLFMTQYKSRGATYGVDTAWMNKENSSSLLEEGEEEPMTTPHLYEVKPTGPFEQDPNDHAGSFRTRHPLQVVRHVPDTEWNDDIEHLNG